ncbi:MAG: hypothetical protein NZO58_12640 [Gemmataceae bacterium]|nr:hypothetical protein [Gemmataceae bacterium]
MRFWFREVAGWLLVAAGLYVFYCVLAITLTDRPLLLSAGPLLVLGIVVFRGGIHLLKVAVAARICSQTTAPPPRPNSAVQLPKRTEQPLEW